LNRRPRSLVGAEAGSLDGQEQGSGRGHERRLRLPV